MFALHSRIDVCPSLRPHAQWEVIFMRLSRASPRVSTIIGNRYRT
jgi:hypothetical protein